MRRINRGQQPDAIDRYLQDRKAKGIVPCWDDFAMSEYYGEVRQKIHGRFGGLCAYCEEATLSGKNPGSIDHFRPQHPQPTDSATQQSCFGCDLTFAWSNWLYACGRCQKAKGNKWPGTVSQQEDDANNWVSKKSEDGGWEYIPPSVSVGYVDPTGTSSNPLDIFTFDELGMILPKDNLDDEQKSIAWRTIYDLKLNSRTLRLGRRVHFAAVREELTRVPRSKRSSVIRSYCCAEEFKYDSGGPSLRIQFISYMAFAGRWLNSDYCMPQPLRDACDFFKEYLAPTGSRGPTSA